MMGSHMENRREFLQTGATLAAAAAAESLGFSPSAKAADRTPPRVSIGIQVGSASFVDEGTEKVLDIFQDRGAIDTIYLTTFTFGRGLAGRQIPGQPFPDHGVQASDERSFRGGNYATPHAEFYRNTVLRPGHAPDHGDLDIVATVAPAAKKRGLRVFCSIEDVFRADVPGAKRPRKSISRAIGLARFASAIPTSAHSGPLWPPILPSPTTSTASSSSTNATGRC